MNSSQRIELIEPIAVLEPQPPAQRAVATVTTPTDLIAMAVQQGADLDRLERLYALKVQYEKHEAEKAYNAAFTEFKADAVTIVKNRSVTDGPLKGKKYAELFAVVNAITPALSRHGLSASWKLTKDERDWIEVTCTLKHTLGHFETVSMGGPPDAGGAKNAIQARASTVSYLERYTLKAITGLSEQEEDNDGNGDGDDVEVGTTRTYTADEKLVEAMTDAGRAAAMEGMDSLTKWWAKLSAREQKLMNPHFGALRRAARAADQGGKR